MSSKTNNLDAAFCDDFYFQMDDSRVGLKITFVCVNLFPWIYYQSSIVYTKQYEAEFYLK